MMPEHKFRPCERVFHAPSRMVGTFERHDPRDQAMAHVYFPAAGESRLVAHDDLEPAGERW